MSDKLNTKFIKATIVLCLLLPFSGCIEKLNNSDPRLVATLYNDFTNKGNYTKAFKLVSDSSKVMTNLQEFTNHYESYKGSRPTGLKTLKLRQMPIDLNHPNYRSFEIQEYALGTNEKDTILEYSYLQLFSDNYKDWKVVWTKQLENEAERLLEKSKFIETIELCDKIIEYNPLTGKAFHLKAWSFYRMRNSWSLEETGMKALELEPHNPQSHKIVSVIYSSKGLYESAKIWNLRAAKLVNDYEQKSIIYSNISIDCEALKQQDSVIFYLRKAILYYENTHALLLLALSYEAMNNTDSSLIYFEKALKSKPMDNYLQTWLYNSYSGFLLNQGKNLSEYSINENLAVQKARNLTLMSLELDPNNEETLLILKRVNELK